MAKTQSAKRIDLINIGLMLVSLLFAFHLPFHTFLMAYAILGPLHYLTEIGWLDDRNYFANRKKDVWILVGLCAFVTLSYIYGQLPKFTFTESWQTWIQQNGLQSTIDFIRKWQYSAHFVAFVVGLSMAFIKNKKIRYPVILAGIIAAIFLHDIRAYFVLIGVLLPTLIHVYLFTGLFILYGALKSKSVSGFASLVVFVGVVFFIAMSNPDGKDYILSEYWVNSMTATNFMDLNAIVSQFFGWHRGQFAVYSKIAIKLQIFVAFAYTYHYLNWFSKTKVINWHKVARPRLYTAILVWAASIALYFFDYKLGLAALFF